MYQLLHSVMYIGIILSILYTVVHGLIRAPNTRRINEASVWVPRKMYIKN